MIKATTLIAKYKRSEISPNHTFLWKNLDDQIKLKLTSVHAKLKHEEPILVFYKLDDYWILTDNTLINSNSWSYPISQISKVNFLKYLDDNYTKKNLDRLEIIFTDGSRRTLLVELGTWHVIHDILKFISKHYRNN